jgi:TRAP-type C4-dicarboxylate transport system permease small subunit
MAGLVPAIHAFHENKTWMPGTRPGMTWRGEAMAKKRVKSSKRRAPARKKANEGTHLIVAEDADVIIERHPEDWIAIIIFWSLAFIVFLQFFTRYILNDSLSWTEEIARYGLMWVTFIGGIMVTRRGTHIAVELMSNLMKPGPARVALLIFIDLVKLLFLALLAYFSITITERMDSQRMTVFDVPMSYVYAGVAVGCIGMFLRQAHNVWRNYKMQWRRQHDMHDQVIAD